MTGGDVLVNGENAQSILQASTFLQCPLAEMAAADYMMSNITLANAFSVFFLALNCGSVYLANQLETFILKCLRTFQFQISSVMDVLEMNKEKLDSCLDLIHDNFAAFGIICGWTLYEIGDRKKYLSELFDNHLVPEIIPSDAIEAIEDEFEGEAVISKALEKSHNYDSLPLRGKINYWESTVEHKKCSIHKLHQKRWPKMAIVCSTGNNFALIAYRSDSYDQWLRLTTKPEKLKVKSSGSVVVVAGETHNPGLYFIGGVGNLQMWSYGLKNDSWKLLSPEQDERIRPLVCSFEANIYVFGGYTDRSKQVTYLDSAAKFDTKALKWTTLCPMECSRSGGQACYLDGHIYLFGGLCSRRRAVVSCEFYNIENDEYDSLTNLPSMIIDFGLVLVESERKIYIVGGMDPLTFETKNSVLVFDLTSRSWSHDFPSLNVARKSSGCFFDGANLYVVGGSTAELGQLSSVERFCPETRKWKIIDSLPRGLAATTTSVVAELPVRLMQNYRELGQSNMS